MSLADRFWRTGEPGALAAAPFAEAVAELARGPHHGPAPTGELVWDTLAGHPTTVVVPADYDPARAYPVRVFLHGGLARRLDDPDRAKPLAFAPRYLAVYPTGTRAAPWWSAIQLANLRAILDRLKLAYHVDPDRVGLVGVSDGGTGAFYVAMRDPTPWSTFVSLNGFVRVLGRAATGVDGELFAANLANRPLHAINGERDPLYPADVVAPYVERLRTAGAELTFASLAGAGHDTSWWPREMPAVDAFTDAHPRDPLPAALSWTTARTDRDHRIAWLAIDHIDPAAPPADLDVIDRGPRRGDVVLPHALPAGRVDVWRDGNRFAATTRGVRAFTLLLSPSAVDFARPVEVVVDGRTAFVGVVQPNVATLLRHAARDRDPAMLFGAELTIAVP